jgi:AICAR transformylase/IMP cyclohydrolase PurH
MKMKYGMNPYQDFANIDIPEKSLAVENGEPSYINFLDALNAWQLVRELKVFFKKPAAASFKHVTPSGTALCKELNDNEKKAYFTGKIEISPLCSAYLRARGSDRLASFGDFIALSDIVDVSTAKIIQSEVSNGIIAPGYQPEALEILKKKQKGKFIILAINPDYNPPAIEERELFGFRMRQRRNDVTFSYGTLDKILAGKRDIKREVMDDIILGLITLKYTQSNSICVVHDGQTIGIGSGQQSRILCTKLALEKSLKCILKQQDVAIDLEFPSGMTKTMKDQVVEEHISSIYNGKDGFSYLRKLNNLVLCSDGYFPQIDNIEYANFSGIKYIAEPAGSINDPEIIRKCNEYGITLIDTGIRLFHH